MMLHSSTAQISSATRCRIIYLRRFRERLLPVLLRVVADWFRDALPVLLRGLPDEFRDALPALLRGLPDEFREALLPVLLRRVPVGLALRLFL